MKNVKNVSFEKNLTRFKSLSLFAQVIHPWLIWDSQGFLDGFSRILEDRAPRKFQISNFNQIEPRL